MRNAFAKRFAAVMLVLCMLAALPVATAYAADAETGYVVTFRAGEHGTFSDAYIEKLESVYGEAEKEGSNLYVNTARTVISVLVTDGNKMPDAPQLPSVEGVSDIIINDGSKDYVLIDAGVNDDYYLDTPESRAQDYDFVAKYALRGDREDVSYVVRYLLEGTEQEVAPSVRGTAPAGLTLTLTAISVDEYTPVGGSTKQVTVEKNADGSPVEVVFYYSQNVHVNSVTQYEDGGTVVEYNDINVVAGTATAGGGATGTAGGAGGAATGGGAAAGDGAGAAAGDGDAAVGGEGEGAGEAQQPGGGEEVIGDNETPQAGGEETIGDNETPLAESESGVSVPVVVGGIAVLLVVILLVVFLVRKRRNGADE